MVFIKNSNHMIRIVSFCTGLIFLSTSFLFSSCAENDDERPVVSIIAPGEQLVVYTGDTLALVVRFTDNEGLRQYKLDIHANQDGHSHGKSNSGLPGWDTLIINDISGDSALILLSLPIPQGIWTGSYHLTAYALDLSGNQGLLSRNFVVKDVTDTVAPSMSLSSPVVGGTYSGSIAMAGQITDTKSDGSLGLMSNIRVRLVKANDVTVSNVLLNLRESNAWGEGIWNATTGELSGLVSIPTSVGAGAYIFEVRAEDQFGNRTLSELSITLN
jgi:hypothetical protein